MGLTPLRPHTQVNHMATNASIARKEEREAAELSARLEAMEKSIASQAEEIEQLKAAIEALVLTKEPNKGKKK